MNTEKLNAFLTNEASLAKLICCKTVGEGQECLKAAGIDCTPEETYNLMMSVKEAFDKQVAEGGKMDLDDMDAVAGGANTTMVGDMLRGLLQTGSSIALNAMNMKYMMPQMLTETAINIADAFTGGEIAKEKQMQALLQQMMAQNGGM